MKQSLVKDTINKDDIDDLIQWLRTYPRLTKGPKTIELEKKWSSWLNTEFSTFVNSGSSANLIMLYALIVSGELKIGDEVIVPAISWATDLSPVIQFGLKPIICDCNMEDLSIDLQHFRKICKENNPKALMLVSVLGLVPEMDKIQQICEENKIVLLEDTCESLGSKFYNKTLGQFGLMSTFSLYFGHHISTIEGGIVSTDSKEYDMLLKSLRNHGWDRDWEAEEQNKIRKKHNVSDFDALYTFYYPGFNVRSTDLQAHIGLRQIDRIENIIKKREQNFRYYLEFLSDKIWKPVYRDNTFISNFCYPIIHEKKYEIIFALNQAGVENRPLICGSMGHQPMYVSRYGRLSLKNADVLSKNGIYIPNNPEMNKEDVKYISNIINSIVAI